MFGDVLVDANYTFADEFNRPVQDWLASAVWADVWTREEVLDRRTRSLLTIAMLVALNRPEELEMHVRASLTNGCTVEDIREVLLHTGPYCGAPAALSSFRVAERILAEEGLLPPRISPKGVDHV
ncbi:carboxymuconolactone decarboxylase family protein [Microbacterium terregens]|uniref:Carboxymuconolactone decarboxylase family protein n=1 Tax=Microbacterium terregens TaxID=69363 RepID=A0ABV5T3I9_9MICO